MYSVRSNNIGPYHFGFIGVDIKEDPLPIVNDNQDKASEVFPMHADGRTVRQSSLSINLKFGVR
jgi:hypothetical protein